MQWRYIGDAYYIGDAETDNSWKMHREYIGAPYNGYMLCFSRRNTTWTVHGTCVGDSLHTDVIYGLNGTGLGLYNAFGEGIFIDDDGDIFVDGLTDGQFVKTTTDGQLVSQEFIDLSTEVGSSILSVANGGTGVDGTAFATGEFLAYNDVGGVIESTGFDSTDFMGAAVDNWLNDDGDSGSGLYTFANGEIGGWGSWTLANGAVQIQNGTYNMHMDGNSIVSDGAMVLGVSTSNDLSFGTDDTERMKIAADGTISMNGVSAGTETDAMMIDSSGNLSKRTLDSVAFDGVTDDWIDADGDTATGSYTFTSDITVDGDVAVDNVTIDGSSISVDTSGNDTLVDADGSTTNGVGTPESVGEGDTLTAANGQNLCTDNLTTPTIVVTDDDADCTNGYGVGSVLLGTPDGSETVAVDSTWAFIDADTDTAYDVGEDLYIDGGSGSGTADVANLGDKDDAWTGVYAETFYGKNTSIANFDLAEDYKAVDQSIAAGDVVAFTDGSKISIDKTDEVYQKNVIGVVSTQPGLRLSDWSVDEEEYSKMRPIALAGRVPVKVSTENGAIERGDYLVPASKEGYAMKACGDEYCEAGMVIGIAMEDFDEEEEGDSNQVKEELTMAKEEIQEEIESTVEELEVEVEVTDSEKVENELVETKEDAEQLAEVVDVLTEELDSGETDRGEGRIMMFVSHTWYQPLEIVERLGDTIQNLESRIQGGGEEVKGEELKVKGEGGDMVLEEVAEVGISDFSSEELVVKILMAEEIEVENLVASGSIGVAGDITLGGELMAEDEGDIIVRLSDEGGDSKFEIQDEEGEALFAVDSEGKIESKGIYESKWVKVDGESDEEIDHDLGDVPRFVNIMVSEDKDGGDVTNKGVGVEYYYEDLDDDSVKVVNEDGEDVYIKVVLWR